MTITELIEELVPPEKRWLGMMIFISLIGHLACFFVFKIDSSGMDGFPRRPDQIILLTDSLGGGVDKLQLSEENLWTWLEWKDPSVIAFPTSDLPEITAHVEGVKPPEEIIHLPQRDFLFQEQLKETLSEDLSNRAQQRIETTHGAPMPIRVETPPPLSGTTYQLQGVLEQLKIKTKVEFPRPQTNQALGVTILSVGIDERGWVEHILVDQSCGDSSIDRLALNEVKKWQFESGEKNLEKIEEGWGRIIVFWDLREKEIGSEKKNKKLP